jgi:rubrerythrin
MSWRPEGWKNPHTKTPQSYAAFEAGADGMVEALKKKGAWMTPDQMKLLAPERAYPYGWIVFIPAEQEPTPEAKLAARKGEVFKCQSCGYEGDGWLNDGYRCPQCGFDLWPILLRQSQAFRSQGL